MVSNGLQVAGIGIAAGLAASVALAGLVQGLLFEVRAADPGTLASAALILFVTAAACAAPAWRASRANPVLALRNEWSS